MAVDLYDYLDRFDPKNGYMQLIANPGNVAQAREFTEAQTTLRYIIKSLGDSLWDDGDIIEGCDINLKEDIVTVTPGKIYLDGIVMDVPRTEIPISLTSSKENICVVLHEEVITVVEDPTLVDPVGANFTNSGRPGCSRLKRWIEVGKNIENSNKILGTYNNGVLEVEPQKPEFGDLTNLLAERTYDESGSYIVEGLKVELDTLDETKDSYNIIVNQGTAYIKGYKVTTGGNRRISVDKSNKEEDKLTNTADPTYKGPLYKIIDSPYISEITSVSGRILKETSSGTLSPFQIDGNSVKVVSIEQGDKVYEENVHYEVDDTQTDHIVVKWIESSGSEELPLPAGTYYIKYTSRETFLPNSGDYKLKFIDGGSYIVWEYPDDPSRHPLEGEDYDIYYRYHKARKDLVCINTVGNIEVFYGTPDIYGKELLPEVPHNNLVLATIENPPNGGVRTVYDNSDNSTDSHDGVILENIGLTRFTMQDIQNILSRVQTMQYDLAVNTLNADAQQVYTANDKLGIFTEPLVDLSRIDFYYRDANLKVDKPLYNMALDLACNICYLPVVTNTEDIRYSATQDNESTRPHRYKRLMSLKTAGESVVESQLKASSTLTINPYSTFSQSPEISIDPSVDSWIEDTIIEVPISITDYTIVNMSTSTIDNRRSYQINNSNYSTRTTSNTVTTNIGTKVSDPYISSSEILEERSITYIRPREITVEGTNFRPGLDNIECTFDGVLVTLTPIDGTVNGSTPGTVKADELGRIKATFNIPERVLTGMREVRLKSKNTTSSIETVEGTSYMNEGFTFYIAEGISRKIKNTVTTVTTVLQNRVTTNTLSAIYVDPIGQSFVLDNMKIIKGVNVYFEQIPSARIPVVCEIRGVTNGTINSTIYTSKSLFPEDISKQFGGGVDSVSGNVPCRFDFDDPILLDRNIEYAIVLRSTSNSYRVWIAELNLPNLSEEGKPTITENPYMKGVLFSSSNNSTWSAHQTADLKFELIEDNYDSESIAIFDDVTLEAARIYLSADSVIPQGTKLDWEYSLRTGNTYSAPKTLTPYNIIQLNEYHRDNIRLIATFRRNTNENLTPLLALDTMSLTCSYYELNGWYVSKNIENLDRYEEVKLVVETYEPVSGSDGESPLTFYISKDARSSRTEATGTSEDYLVKLEHNSKYDRNVGNNWVEKTYEITGLEIPEDPNASEDCRVFVKASSTKNHLTPAFRKLRVIFS